MPSILDDCPEGYLTLANDAGQVSLWPASFAVPAGWRVLAHGSRDHCILAAEQERLISVGLLAAEAPAPDEAEADLTFPAMFEHQASQTPGAIAILATGPGELELTFAQLSRLTDQVALLLRRRNVGAGSTVAVLLPRSADTVVAFIAVLKAGATYLPIDPTYPTERIRELLADAQPSLLVIEADSGVAGAVGSMTPSITANELLSLAAGIDSDAATEAKTWLPKLHPDTPAYLIYTSGSTGVAKGVVITHRGFAGLRGAYLERLSLADDARVAMVASVSFDASIWEMCMALLTGAALVILPQQAVAAGAALAKFLTRHRVTHFTVGPAVLATLAADSLPTVRVLVSAGEACSREIAAVWIPGRSMLNAYGPTETTVCATVSAPLVVGETPPLGKALPSCAVLVLDDELQPVRVGAVAELFVTGMALAAGYLNRPDLTAQRFLASPYGPPGSRMYRTGDLVKVVRDGRLEFSGRVDEQFKIHGFRIEPAEVVSALLAHPAVAQAVVLPHEDDRGERRLVGYVVAVDGTEMASPASLREFLGRRLPAHLVPSVYVVLNTIPLTPNGKVDRNRLPFPALGAQGIAAGDRPHDDDLGTLERTLCVIFAEVLDVPSVGPTDDFFDLGGTSLHMIAAMSRIADKCGIELSPGDIFRAPTVAELSVIVRGAR